MNIEIEKQENKKLGEKTKGPKKPNKDSKALINRKRTLSRLMAIQTLYQFHFYDEKKDINEMKEFLINNYILEQEDKIKSFRRKIDLNLIESLLTGIQMSIDEIDHDITSLLKDGWNLEMLPDISLYILRFGAFELKFMKDVPLKVVIDEYVDISASFFDSKQVTFLNGTLDSLAKHYRAEEFEKVGNHKKVTKTVVKAPKHVVLEERRIIKPRKEAQGSFSTQEETVEKESDANNTEIKKPKNKILKLSKKHD